MDNNQATTTTTLHCHILSTSGDNDSVPPPTLNAFILPSPRKFVRSTLALSPGLQMAVVVLVL
jgi:hypothetical protein